LAISRTDDIAEALWYSRPGQAEIRQETLAAPGVDEVRVRALYGAISRGTEALVLAGRVPTSEFERMRAPFMAGHFPFPVKYGYATVGRIEDGPEALLGRPVFTLHPHQDLFNVPASAAIPLPADIPPQRAVLAANMETALNAVWDAAPGPADRIAVVGAGVVGALVAYLCGRLPGAEVTLIDINPARKAIADRLGVGFAGSADAPRDQDLVINTSGSDAGLQLALELVVTDGEVIEASWYADRSATLMLGGDFHSRRLTIRSSQVGAVAARRRGSRGQCLPAPVGPPR